jgi:hypothetical protein
MKVLLNVLEHKLITQTNFTKKHHLHDIKISTKQTQNAKKYTPNYLLVAHQFQHIRDGVPDNRGSQVALEGRGEEGKLMNAHEKLHED